MDFTFGSYIRLLNLIKTAEYNICCFGEEKNDKSNLIIRHDIDISLEKAYEFAVIEKENEVKSTYCIMLTSDFYNALKRESIKLVREINEMGHRVGLHFDETQYSIVSSEELTVSIRHEIELFKEVFNLECKTVSMHRPSRFTLDSNYMLSGEITNTYSQKYFSAFKYYSDSRMRWKADVESVISNKEYKDIQLLIHPIWYHETQKEIGDVMRELISSAEVWQKRKLSNNISGFNEIIK